MPSNNSLPCYLFAGPTLYNSRQEPLSIPDDICPLPPVSRGQIQALIEKKEHLPGTIIMVDGLFHHQLAVAHAEIRTALEQGWQVWGLSSMGAIRAYEMRTLGMRGFGEVYETFLREDGFQDDEVTLLHEPEPPYRAISEPLVHFRVALWHAEQQGWITPSVRQEIVERLKSQWYGDRTMAGFRQFLLSLTPSQEQESLKQLLHHFDNYRVKRNDLATFLTSDLWR